MKRLQQETERMEKKVERKRRELKRHKKSMKKNEAKLRTIQEQFEKVKKAILQVHQNNAFTDAFVEINLDIFEAEHAGNFLAAEQHADTVRDLMARWCEEKQDSDNDDDEDED